MSILDNNRRKHDDLRTMVDKACAGVMPHIDKRIKDVARRAYFLGARDGMELARQQQEEANEGSSDNLDAGASDSK